MTRDKSSGLDDDLRRRIATRLEGVGQRFTASREALVTALAHAERPLTIPEIADVDSSLAVSSTYRNLTTLEAVGVVHRVVTHGDFAYYQLAEGLTDRHHHHLICSNCGAVEDFDASPELEQAVRGTARQIGRRTGFRTERHVVDLIGLCANCT